MGASKFLIDDEKEDDEDDDFTLNFAGVGQFLPGLRRVSAGVSARVSAEVSAGVSAGVSSDLDAN